MDTMTAVLPGTPSKTANIEKKLTAMSCASTAIAVLFENWLVENFFVRKYVFFPTPLP